MKRATKGCWRISAVFSLCLVRLTINKIGRYRPAIFLFLCGWFLLSAGAIAVDKVLDASLPDQKPVSLTEYFAVLEDPGLTLTLADVRKPDTASRFKGGQAPAAALSYGFTRSAYWLRLTLRNPSDRPMERMLEIGYPLLSNIQLYQPTKDGTYRSSATGAATPFSTRPYPNRFFVFPLVLPEHADQVVYLRLQSASSMLVPARLWEPRAFHAYERGDYVAQAWYFGTAMALILFNLLIFIALRDVVYLQYVVFAIGAALTISAGNGWGKEFIWPDATLWSNIAVSVFGAFTLAALLVFMRRMLNTREVIPRLDRLVQALIGIHLLFPIGFAVSVETFAIPSTFFIFVTTALILFVGMYCAFVKQQRIALFFVAAFSMWILGVLVVGLKTVTLLPANALTMNGWQIGSALEMLLLAFALAYRFNMIRRKAADDVKLVNANLEERLQVREVELKESHQRLREVEQREMLSQERQRLMEDMHDGLGSSLVSALQVVEHGQLDKVDIAQVLKGCIDDLKLTLDSMEPVEADLLLLLATLRFRLGPRLLAVGIDLHWEIQDVPALNWLNPRNSLHILRILQETFTNIIKHAKASEIRVATAVGNGGVVVTVTDNGQGFDIEQAMKNGGKGMSNQMRRAEAISGKASWDASDKGTRFSLWLPL